MENYGKLLVRRFGRHPCLPSDDFLSPLYLCLFKMWPKSKNNDTKTHATEKKFLKYLLSVHLYSLVI